MERNCNNHHKYGLWLQIGTTCQRQCKCCGTVKKYPITDEIMAEIAKQDEAIKMLKILLHGDLDIIQSSDSFIILTGCLLDELNYLDLDKDTQERYVEKTELFNEYFHSQKAPERYNIIKNFIVYLKLFFKKETLEEKAGFGSFSEMENEQLWNIYENVSNQINDIIEKIHEEKNEKGHLVGR